MRSAVELCEYQTCISVKTAAAGAGIHGCCRAESFCLSSVLFEPASGGGLECEQRLLIHFDSDG